MCRHNKSKVLDDSIPGDHVLPCRPRHDSFPSLSGCAQSCRLSYDFVTQYSSAALQAVRHDFNTWCSSAALQAKNIMIAVGGRAVKAPIDGAEHTITSDEILEIPKVTRVPQGGVHTVHAGWLGIRRRTNATDTQCATIEWRNVLEPGVRPLVLWLNTQKCPAARLHGLRRPRVSAASAPCDARVMEWVCLANGTMCQLPRQSCWA